MSAALTWLRRPWVAFLLDAVLVVVFAAVGRATHAEASGLGGIVGTATPFLLGMAGGWALVRWRGKAWPLRVGPGITVWAATLLLGMALRWVAGTGIAASFVVVAGLVLAVFLVGWRALVPVLAARAPRRDRADPHTAAE